MARYLDEIVAWHRARAARDDRDLERLSASAHASVQSDPPRGFEAALRASEGIAVIAEIKRRSPSKGELALDLDPAVVAKEYDEGGAACLSVLTDGPHFGGSAEDLAAARDATALPVLRKDFTVGIADVLDARLMGADAVLLIAAVLDDDELSRCVGAARDLGLAALVEVHDEAEAERALAARATLVGINQRDLRTFEVDTERALRLAAGLAGEAVLVAESGIACAEDVAALGRAGFDAVLVGERLVTALDRSAAVRSLAGLSAMGAG